MSWNEPALERFLWWIYERDQIRRRREAGQPWPWTEDAVLQTGYFCNVHREYDKVTRWFVERYRGPWADNPCVMFGTICFRWFNLPSPTGDMLLHYDLLNAWDDRLAYDLLHGMWRDGQKIFTGAYIINSAGGIGIPKWQFVWERLCNVWNMREALLAEYEKATTLEAAHKILMQVNGIGGFMSYEVITDLRHTYLLRDATDIDTWAHLGPGARKGMSYLYPGYQAREMLPLMRSLIEWTRMRLPDVPRLEMREIEHSLCEFQKYEAGRTGNGRLKRRYKNGK